MAGMESNLQYPPTVKLEHSPVRINYQIPPIHYGHMPLVICRTEALRREGLTDEQIAAVLEKEGLL